MKPLSRCICFASMLVALSACSGPQTSPPTAAGAGSEEAIATAGDVTVRASAIQTSTLDDAVARQYGIARDPRTVMLLIAVRKGSGDNESSLPARITASASGLTGAKQDIAMRELRTGELLDYIGTVETTLPETLRFDVAVVREDGAISTLRFNREFYPK